VRTARTLRRDWRFHAGYGLLRRDWRFHAGYGLLY